ncbi:dynamin family protein [Ruminococcus flavefaciens]|uniref:dynamin family protein n=1 Tax=Ruminococcus flavefaciens TaxID=1265 RepID=UPI0026F2A6DF|nr:dynamin family protein [Ruminococcus flavefaciens]
MNKTEVLQQQINNLLLLKSIQKNNHLLTELDTLRLRISDNTFRIAVVGEFSSGKSTFINAIIGKNLLKHASSETTAAITYICNVEEGDSREGTCEITFNDGEIIHFPDFQKLKEYTTVNDTCKVTEEIRYVTVYTHFLNCAYPIIITDTPGLNGIADKHREITLDEIRKAHMCIYLLSNNGVKLSDSDFIKVLLQYQNRFIFVQNFMDMLRTSEGETCESKLDKDRENLDICFQNTSTEVNYQLFGLSAVKALAARDHSIKKVFETDVKPICDRESLLEESNFVTFQDSLTKTVNSGEYLQFIVDSASHTLLFLIEQLQNGLEIEAKISEEMRRHDRRNLNIERANKVISQLNEQIPEKEQSLENFITVQDIENRKILKESAHTQLDSLLTEIVKQIDKFIQKFEDIETMEVRFGKTVPKYFSDVIAQELNSRIIPDLDKNIIEHLDHLYDQAILKVTNFSTDAKQSIDRIHISLTENTTSFNPESVSGREQIERDKQTVANKQSQLQKVEKQKNEAEAEKSCVNDKMNSAERDRQNAAIQNQQESANLGPMPSSEQIRVERTREVERTGLFHRTRDWLFGKRTETYYETKLDYTKQNEWKLKKADAERRARARLERCDENIRMILEKLNRIELELRHSLNEKEKLEEDIRDLNSRIKREQDIYEKLQQANKQEFCENEKRRIKEDIRNALFELQNGESVFEHMEIHIDRMSEDNLPGIRKSVMAFFQKSVSERIQNLQNIINAGNDELNQIYDISNNDLKALEEIVGVIKTEVVKDE